MRVELKVWIIAIALLGGCSWGRSPKIEAVPTGPEQIEETSLLEDETGDSSESKPPVSVKITQAFVSEGELKVKVHVRAKTRLDPKRVAVAAVGLKDGETVSEQIKLLSDVTGVRYLEDSDTIAVGFSLPHESLTEYQVKCGWGKDAREMTVRAAPELPSRGEQDSSARARLQPRLPEPDEPSKIALDLALEDITTDKIPLQCSHPPCDVLYIVNARLTNHSARPVLGPKLALGLHWVNDGSEAVLPDAGAPLAANEEVIELTGTLIPSGEHKKIRVKVDRPVPVVRGGQFLPHLRLVDTTETLRPAGNESDS